VSIKKVKIKNNWNLQNYKSKCKNLYWEQSVDITQRWNKHRTSIKNEY